ncbi:LCP family glycopolymer transferase [Jeotgalibacillus haloalkalitolerans]|uniref:LCP family protein n=1 Tax=Jeotgalibacillus haloalkalitolerans TaxID=3104292 RepID=A0ABU5KIM9_9BACL|nr:LCP family protein [Jeotgalibacillus sp. HH7-29]MDZ5711047.1 LCP family protein [Jeotgalibacillus sp. HH7-29]
MRERKWIGKDHQLRFTERDQSKVFEKIHSDGAYKKKNRNLTRVFPAVAAILFLMIGGILVIPMMTDQEKMPANVPDDAVPLPADQEDSIEDTLTLLTLVGSDEAERRIEYGVVTIYNPASRSMKMTTIPRDTLMTIFINNEGETTEDKFTHSAAYNGIEGAAESVESLVRIEVDETVWLDELTVNKLLAGAGLDGEMPTYYPNDEQTPIVREEKRLEVLKAYFAHAGSDMSLPDIQEEFDVSPDAAKIIKANEKIMTVNLMEEAQTDQIDGIYYEVINDESMTQFRKSLKRHLLSDEGIFTFTNFDIEDPIEDQRTYFLMVSAEWTGHQPAFIESVEITDREGNPLNEEGLTWSMYVTPENDKFGLFEDYQGELIGIEGSEIDELTEVALKFETDHLVSNDDRRLKITYSFEGESREQLVEWDTLSRLNTTVDETDSSLSEETTIDIAKSQWKYELKVNGTAIPENGTMAVSKSEVDVLLTEQRPVSDMIPEDTMMKGKISEEFYEHIESISSEPDDVSVTDGTTVTGYQLYFDMNENDKIELKISSELQERLGLESSSVIILKNES